MSSNYLQIKITLVNSVHNIIIVIFLYYFKVKNNKIIPKLSCIKLMLKMVSYLKLIQGTFFTFYKKNQG